MAGLLVSPVRAEQASGDPEGHRWWAEVGFGYGRLELKAQSATLHKDSFAFNYTVGLRVSPHVKVGLDLGGYNLQSTCVSTPSHPCSPSDLEHGRGIEHLFIVADYRPAVHDGWLLHAGLGATNYWDQSVSPYYDHANSYGWGGELGTGYTWRLGFAAHLGFRVGYEFGHLSGSGSAWVPPFDYSALKVTLVCAYY